MSKVQKLLYMTYFMEKKDKEGKILMTYIVIIILRDMTKTTATRKLIYKCCKSILSEMLKDVYKVCSQFYTI